MGDEYDRFLVQADQRVVELSGVRRDIRRLQLEESLFLGPLPERWHPNIKGV